MPTNNPPSAAASIYPHLPSDKPTEAQQPRASSLAQVMYPRPKLKPSNRYDEILIKNLRELNARIKAEKR